MISRTKTLRVQFNDSPWSLAITVEKGDPVAKAALYWRYKDSPTHVGEVPVSEIAELVE